MTTDLDDKLAEVGHALQDLIARQNLLDAVETDLKAVTRDKPFTVWNEVVWLMIFDTISMLRINLGAWGKSIYEKGGLIGDLQAHHRTKLPRDPPGLSGLPLSQNVRIDAFKRLFSCSCEPLPTDAGFSSLRDQVACQMKPVLDDRHERAHSYKRGAPVQSTAALDHAGLREALGYARQLFNDLSIVTSGQSWHFSDWNTPSSPVAAADLVDAVLIGWSDRLPDRPWKRDDFYAALHAEHDASPPGSLVPFNGSFGDDRPIRR